MITGKRPLDVLKKCLDRLEELIGHDLYGEHSINIPCEEHFLNDPIDKIRKAIKSIHDSKKLDDLDIEIIEENSNTIIKIPGSVNIVFLYPLK